MKQNIFSWTLYGKQPYESTNRPAIEASVRQGRSNQLHVLGFQRWQFHAIRYYQFGRRLGAIWNLENTVPRCARPNVSHQQQHQMAKNIKWPGHGSSTKDCLFSRLALWKTNETSHPSIQLLITKHHQKQLHLSKLICFSFWLAINCDIMIKWPLNCRYLQNHPKSTIALE